MARQLKETANTAHAVAEAKPEGAAQTVLAEEDWKNPFRRKFTPFTTREELPEATYTVKNRVIALADGSTKRYTETKCTAVGEARYKVTDKGELIKIYKKHGGTGTRMIYQFKQKYPESEWGNKRKAFDNKFKKYLKSQGVPGV